ncbi:MAG TPA: hypothetical protein VIF60_13815 [Burkholderiaceae bacterium]
MRFNHWKFITTTLLWLLPFFASAAAAPYKPDVGDLTQELQQVEQKDGLAIVWWLPDEFWIASSQRPGDMDATLKALDPYVLVVVLDGKIDSAGGLDFKSEEEVRGKVRILDSAGNAYKPLPFETITDEAKALIERLKPRMSKSLGQVGEGAVFVVFSKYDNNRKPIVLPRAAGRFHIVNGTHDFSFRLPLSALSPKVKCKSDPELFPSNYKYCPFDGTPTVPQAGSGSAK